MNDAVSKYDSTAQLALNAATNSFNAATEVKDELTMSNTAVAQQKVWINEFVTRQPRYNATDGANTLVSAVTALGAALLVTLF